MQKATIWNNLFFLAIEGILFMSIYVWRMNIPCFFESFLQIPCPFCYMTQAMDELLALNFTQAIITNPLLVIVLPVVFVWNAACIADIFTLCRRQFFARFMKKVILRWWSVLIVVCGWIYILFMH